MKVDLEAKMESEKHDNRASIRSSGRTFINKRSTAYNKVCKEHIPVVINENLEW